MPEPAQGFQRLLHPVQRRLAQVDLRQYEDKILLSLALVVSAVVGLIVVAFVVLTEHLSKLLLTADAAQRVLSPVVGSLVGGWLLFRFFPEARGSGIPQTRVALVLRNGFISLRTVVGKFICSSISLSSGVALGREGPSVHIGAGLASFAGRRLGLSDAQVRSLIPVGTAAAVAAAFNTPLAAVLFTLEEILADLNARVVGSVVIGAATSWIVLRVLLGDEPLFHVPAYQLVHPIEFLVYALLGVAGGVVSTAFVKLILGLRAMFKRVPTRWQPFAPAVGGLTVGLLSLIAPGVLGVGYNLVSDALNGQLALQMMLLLLVLKIIATATCYSSGNAGGVFGPSLFIGAMLGGVVGQAAHTLVPDHTGNAGAYALVGMGAAFAGIVRSPMTSVIMIFEVTRDYTIIVPLMIANLCSFFLSQRLQPRPIYEALSYQDGIIMPSADHRLEPLTVERAMRPFEATDADLAAEAEDEAGRIHPDDPLDTALQQMGVNGRDRLPVLSRVGAKPVGVLTMQNAFAAYRHLEQSSEASAADGPRQNWLPVVAAITVSAVLLVSGLLLWQRSRRHDLGEESYRRAEQLLAQGSLNEAVAAYRGALALTPQDDRIRAALGLALVRTGHFAEASAYLTAVAKKAPANGPVAAGLARIAQANGDAAQALPLLRQALAKDWPASAEADRREAQLSYALLLTEFGRQREANSLLLSLIAQRGDDPALGKRAAEMIEQSGSPEQLEEAYLTLTGHFPGDAGVWLGLGRARLREDKDALALDAYRRAAKTDPENAEARASVARVERMLALDPTRRGLPVRERARRWDELLQRVVAAALACPAATPTAKAVAAKAAPLLARRALTLESSDQKMEAALAIWLATDQECHGDPVLTHILAKVRDAP